MKIKDRLSIGERIRMIRKERGITQAALAKKLGISPVNISQIENGSRNPTVSTLQEIADALDVSLSAIMVDPGSAQIAVETTKTPAESGERHVTDDDIKFALFGTTDIDDETFEDVKALARVAAERAAKRKRKKE